MVFPEPEEEKDDVDFAQIFFIVIFTMMAFAFVPAAWIMFVVREKDTKCKHQQVRRWVWFDHGRLHEDLDWVGKSRCLGRLCLGPGWEGNCGAVLPEPKRAWFMLLDVTVVGRREKSWVI